MRLHEGILGELYNKYLFDYHGDDPVVLSLCQRIATQLLLDPQANNWEHQIEVIKKSYCQGAISEPYRIQYALRPYDEVERMKLQIAQEIAASPQMFPYYLVSLAEARCRMDVGSKITPVGEIAKRENWFNL
jgi:hypothetical protein